MALPFLNQRKKRIDQVVAIDLGAHRTKAVRLQHKQDRFSLLGFAVMPAPSRDKGQKADVLADHLRKLLKPLGEGCHNAALAVGCPEAFLRQAEMPPMPINHMREMLRLNSKTYLQQDYPDHIFDCTVVLSKVSAEKPPSAKPAAEAGLPKQKLLVGGIKRQSLEDVKAACRGAGLVPIHVLPGMAGPINAFENAEPEMFAKDVVALVDIGLKQTTISMLRQGDLAMNRVVASGGDHLTASLVEANSVSAGEAENLKAGMSEATQQALEPVIISLGRELRVSIDFFEHQQELTVSQVFLSGGSAGHEFIIRALQTEMMVPCKAWNPVRRLELALPVEQRASLEQAAPDLAVAVGTGLAVF